MKQPLPWLMCTNVLFLIHLNQILFIMTVREPWITFDGARLKTQNPKIRTCRSFQNNNLVSSLWKRDWGRSWAGMKIVPASAAPSATGNVNNKAICCFRCQDGTADNYQLTLQSREWSFEGPSSKLCCFALLSMISRRVYLFISGQRGAVFNEQTYKSLYTVKHPVTHRHSWQLPSKRSGVIEQPGDHNTMWMQTALLCNCWVQCWFKVWFRFRKMIKFH